MFWAKKIFNFFGVKPILSYMRKVKTIFYQKAPSVTRRCAQIYVTPTVSFSRARNFSFWCFLGQPCPTLPFILRILIDLQILGFQRIFYAHASIQYVLCNLLNLIEVTENKRSTRAVLANQFFNKKIDTMRQVYKHPTSALDFSFCFSRHKTDTFFTYFIWGKYKVVQAKQKNSIQFDSVGSEYRPSPGPV
jgi:hypothetical protein